ncbi:MAG: T9SS type A sorting domain-containing protein [Ekhidna sp.]
MKTLFTLFFSFLFLFGYSQELELDFAKRYGIIQNDLSHNVTSVKYYEDSEKYLVAGGFNGQIDLGINEVQILNGGTEGNGFIAIYNSNFDLLNYFRTDVVIISAELSNEMVFVCGRFLTLDVDLNDDNNEIFESSNFIGNGYLVAYSQSGDFIWSQILSSNSSFIPLYCTSSENNVYLVGDFGGSQFGGPLVIENGTESMEVFSGEFGGSVFLLSYDIQGGYQFHHQFYNEIDLIRSTDYENYNGTLYLGLEAREGNINIGISEENILTPEFPNTSLICAYNLENLNLEEYYVFQTENAISGSGNLRFSKTRPSEILVSFGLSGILSFYSHITEAIIPYHENQTTGIASICVLNNEDGSLSKTFFQVEESFVFRDCMQLENDDFIISAEYEGNLFWEGLPLDNLLFQSSATSALFYVNNPLNAITLFNFNSSFQSEMNANILLNSFSGELIIAGRYKGNHDIDFTSNNSSLGDVSDDQAGFLAKYNFDPNTSITEEKRSTALIYPNPSNSNLFVSSEAGNFDYEFRILDVSGKTVQKGVLQSETIDISSLKDGVYYLIIKEYRYKFIKSTMTE